MAKMMVVKMQRHASVKVQAGRVSPTGLQPGSAGSIQRLIGNNSSLNTAAAPASSEGVIQRAKFIIKNSDAGGGLILQQIEGYWDYSTDFSDFLSLYQEPDTIWDTETGKVTLKGKELGHYVFLDEDFIADHMGESEEEEDSDDDDDDDIVDDQTEDDEDSDDDDGLFLPLSARPRNERYILSYDTLRRRRYTHLQVKHIKAPITHAFPNQSDWAKGYNPHHIIPNEVVRDTIKPLNVDPYNDAWNCSMLPNISSGTFSYHGKSGKKEKELPLHSGHKNYNARVARMIKRELPGIERHKDDKKLQTAKDVAVTIRGLIHQATVKSAVTGQIKLDDMEF